MRGLLGAALLALLASPASAKGNVTLPPHIIFVVADDLGWHDVGFRTGGEIRTPTIDGLAQGGLVLDQYYVQSVCSPSRATFMTGRYPLHHTVNDWLQPGTATALPLNETLMPQVLAAAGYRTHMVGKWHLGFTRWAHTPTFRGFESFVGFYAGGEDYFTHQVGGRFDLRREMGARCGRGCSELAWQEAGRYSTRIFTEEAVRVVREHDPAKAPLFLYLAYQAVHSPAEVPASYRDAYNETISDPVRRTFAGMLSCMDEGIGNVTAALRARGMLQDSLVVFSTDNGGPQFDTPGGDYVGSRNHPLRGGKHSIWEGGTRGTAVVWAGERTGLISRERRGTQVSALMHGADLLPTFCGVAGAEAACARLPLDGVDQGSPLFEAGGAVRTEVLYGQHDDAKEVHTGYDTALRDSEGWKLLQGWGGLPDTWSPTAGGDLGNSSSAPAGGCSQRPGQVLLYNVLQDPGERHEVSAPHPDVVARLSARVEALRAEAVDVVGGGGTADPTCPPYPTNRSDPHAGPFWGPWCDPDAELEAFV